MAIIRDSDGLYLAEQPAIIPASSGDVLLQAYRPSSRLPPEVLAIMDGAPALMYSPHQLSREYCTWGPNGANLLDITNSIATGVTISHPTLSSGANLINQTRLFQAVAGALATQSSLGSVNFFYRAPVATRGGFVATFKNQNLQVVAQQKYVAGVFATTSSNPIAAEVNTLTSCVFLGRRSDNVDGFWYIFHNDGAGLCTEISLGADFPISATSMVTPTFVALPGDAGVYYRVTRDDVAGIAPAEGYLTVNIMATNTFLRTMQSQRSETTGGSTFRSGRCFGVQIFPN